MLKMSLISGICAVCGCQTYFQNKPCISCVLLIYRGVWQWLKCFIIKRADSLYVFAWVCGEALFIYPGLYFFLSMKSWLKWRKEGPVRFGVWLNLQPGSVSGVSFCFGMDVWCLFSMFCMVLWKQWVWPRNRSLCSSLFCRYTWLDAVFLSFTQPKTSANISTDIEWQSDMAHWYACEEALAKLMVSSAKAGSCGWWKQVGVKVLAWRKDRANQWKHNSTEAETNNMFQVSFISAGLWVFYYEACGGLEIMFGENETVLTWY